MKIMLLLALTLVATFSGCTSIKSTMLTRFDDNSFGGNSNGTFQHHNQTRPFKGVPIALKVPTHVDVEITETYFLYKDTTKNTISEVVFDNKGERIPRNLDVQITPVSTKQIFTVDFVRPAAGTLTTSATFSDQQYFAKIENEIVDETLQDITAAIKTVAPALGLSASARLGEDMKANIATATRTVAYARFDIDDPSFEELLDAFVSKHLTGCHGCKGRQTLSSPSTESVPLPTPANQGTVINLMGAAPRSQPARLEKVAAWPPAVTRREKSNASDPVLVTPEYVVYAAS